MDNGAYQFNSALQGVKTPDCSKEKTEIELLKIALQEEQAAHEKLKREFREFIDLVFQTREAQKAYFLHREFTDLDDARKLEKKVDANISAFRKREVELELPFK